MGWFDKVKKGFKSFEKKVGQVVTSKKTKKLMGDVLNGITSVPKHITKDVEKAASGLFGKKGFIDRNLKAVLDAGVQQTKTIADGIGGVANSVEGTVVGTGKELALPLELGAGALAAAGVAVLAYIVLRR